MDNNKQPGIIFRAIHISKINFEVFPQNSKERRSQLGVEYNPVVTEDKKRVVVSFSIDPMRDITNPPFKLHLEMVGIFDVENNAQNMDLERFGTQHAPALMFPFVREVIASLTSYGPMEPLLLPPINVLALTKNSQGEKTDNPSDSTAK